MLRLVWVWKQLDDFSYLLLDISGFAFIEFEDYRDAEDAVRDMDGRHVCGVRIKVEMANKSSRY